MHLAALVAQLPEGLERGGQGRLHVHLGTPAIGNGKQVPVQHRAPCVEGGRQAIAHGRLAGQGAAFIRIQQPWQQAMALCIELGGNAAPVQPSEAITAVRPIHVEPSIQPALRNVRLMRRPPSR